MSKCYALRAKTRRRLYGVDAVDRKVVRELIAKAPLVLADLPKGGATWRVHYGLFVRGGATPAARKELAEHDGMVVDLERLYRDLTSASDRPLPEGDNDLVF